MRILGTADEKRIMSLRCDEQDDCADCVLTDFCNQHLFEIVDEVCSERKSSLSPILISSKGVTDESNRNT